MTAADVLRTLRPLGSETYANTLRKHGVPDPVFGVKIEELKKIQKKVKKDYQLAKDLYDTGIYDAMYLAGLIADDARMTEADLQHWLAGARCAATCEYTVAWVAAGSPAGPALSRTWIDSDAEFAQVAGWSTLSGYLSITDDEKLNIAELKSLLKRVVQSIHTAPNRTRYAMNGFVIALGSYVAALTDDALAAAEKIGPVAVNMNGTACKVPAAGEYIYRVIDREAVGKKRKTAKC
jgi:3-methyladenine DNA glycosylase AlkD